MIPAAFVTLPALPLGASGKLDRRALPAPEAAGGPDLGDAFVAPRGPVEEALAAIWATVLRRAGPRSTPIGVHDNFFAIGGDSILSIQIVSRAQAAGLHLTPRQIFQHQTISELAAVAANARPFDLADQGPVTGPVPLTPIQRWWLEQAPASPDHFNQSLFLEARAPLDPAALDAAIAALLEHHDALRLRLARTSSGWEQTFAAPGDPPAITRIDLAAVPDADLPAAVERAAARTQASLDLARGPVFRALHVVLGPARPERLLFVAHHLAVDGVSWRILADDFQAAYASRPPPPTTTAFNRWSERLAALARSLGDRRRGRLLARPRPPRRAPRSRSTTSAAPTTRRARDPSPSPWTRPRRRPSTATSRRRTAPGSTTSS